VAQKLLLATARRLFTSRVPRTLARANQGSGFLVGQGVEVGLVWFYLFNLLRGGLVPGWVPAPADGRMPVPPPFDFVGLF